MQQPVLLPADRDVLVRRTPNWWKATFVTGLACCRRRDHGHTCSHQHRRRGQRSQASQDRGGQSLVTLTEYVLQALEAELDRDAPPAIHAVDDPVLEELWAHPGDDVFDEC